MTWTDLNLTCHIIPDGIIIHLASRRCARGELATSALEDEGASMFLRNYCTSPLRSELGRKPLSRMILASRGVLSARGRQARRIRDRCAQPHLPLSMGKARGDHPAVPLPRPSLSTRPDAASAFRSGPHSGRRQGQDLSGGRALSLDLDLDWAIRAGRSRRRSPTSIGCRTSNWGAKSSYLHVKANWQLVVDNLLDLTHLAFVPRVTIACRAGRHAVVRSRARPAMWWSRAGSSTSPRRRPSSKSAASRATSIAGRIIDFVPPPSCGSTSARSDGNRRPEGTRVNGIGHAQPQCHRRKPRPPRTTSGDRRTIRRQNQETTNKEFSSRFRARSSKTSRSSAPSSAPRSHAQRAATRHQCRQRVIQARRILDRLHGEEQAAMRVTAAE